MMANTALIALIAIVPVLQLIGLAILWTLYRARRVAEGRRTLLVVLGSGGHTGEMMRMLAVANLDKFAHRLYYITSGDALSTEKARDLEVAGSCSGDYTIRVLPRARRVKQSWLTTPFTTAVSSLACGWNVLHDQPDLVLCNGPGTCVPVVLSAWLIRVSRIDLDVWRNTR